MHNKLSIIQLLICCLVPALTIYLDYKLMFIPFIIMFILVGLLPICKHRESLWVYVITSISCIPIGIRLIKSAITYLELEIYELLFIIMFVFGLMNAISFFTLFITRIIWRKQYRLFK